MTWPESSAKHACIDKGGMRMFRMKSVVGAIAVAAMVSTSAFAAVTDGALAPGKPAGVSKAQTGGNGLLLIAGVAVVAGGIALVATSGNSNGTIANSTSSTAP